MGPNDKSELSEDDDNFSLECAAIAIFFQLSPSLPDYPYLSLTERWFCLVVALL